MASTYCQPIADSRSHKSIVKLGFQFSQPLKPSDASVFGYAARFNLSLMEIAAASTDLRSQAPPAVGPLLPSARNADLPEDGEISNSDDDDLPPFEQILARAKPVYGSDILE